MRTFVMIKKQDEYHPIVRIEGTSLHISSTGRALVGQYEELAAAFEIIKSAIADFKGCCTSDYLHMNDGNLRLEETPDNAIIISTRKTIISWEEKC